MQKRDAKMAGVSKFKNPGIKCSCELKNENTENGPKNLREGSADVGGKSAEIRLPSRIMRARFPCVRQSEPSASSVTPGFALWAACSTKQREVFSLPVDATQVLLELTL